MKLILLTITDVSGIHYASVMFQYVGKYLIMYLDYELLSNLQSITFSSLLPAPTPTARFARNTLQPTLALLAPTTNLAMLSHPPQPSNMFLDYVRKLCN